MKLPPSSWIVLSLLSAGKAFTNKEIITLTGLSPRTVRYAIQKLRENRLIAEEWNFEDARQVRYRRDDPDSVKQGEREPECLNRTATKRRTCAGT
ncbi:MAG: helix-turn-helix domain-containing protein [Methanomicrobiales archaeon]